MMGVRSKIYRSQLSLPISKPWEFVKYFCQPSSEHPVFKNFSSTEFSQVVKLLQSNKSIDALDAEVIANLKALTEKNWKKFLQSLLYKEKLEEALQLCSFFGNHKIGTSDAIFWCIWGDTLLKLGYAYESVTKFKQLEEVDPLFTQQISSNPSEFRSNFWYYCGTIWKQQKNYQKAFEAFEMDFVVNGFNETLLGQIADTLISMKNYQDTLPYLRLMEKNYPNTFSYESFTNILCHLGKFEEACENFPKALNSNPNDTNVYANWGLALRRLGKLKEAEDKFKFVLQVDPKDIPASLELTSIFIQDKRYQEAITLLKTLQSEKLDRSVQEFIELSIENIEKKLTQIKVEELQKTS